VRSSNRISIAQRAECGHSVLILEAGPDHSAEAAAEFEVTQVPGLHAVSTENKSVSWRFFVDHYTKPDQLDPKRNENGKIFYPRATGIGGCTIHNAAGYAANMATESDQLWNAIY
jgi:choline dehydrogenase-like flavoprotein